MRTHGLPLAALLVLLPLGLTAALAGCDLLERPALTRAFGIPYEIVGGAEAEIGGVMRQTPYLDREGTFYATVRYEGGCTDHRFRLDYELATEAATIWFFHADNADTCGGEHTELLEVRLPETVLERPSVFLAGPSGDERIVDRAVPSE